MKRTVILVALVVIAGLAGIVRSHSGARATIAELPAVFSRNPSSEVRDEIQKSYTLAPGARVELSDINGAISIETSDTTTADVYIVRTGASQEALNRRKISVEADANGLRIHGAKGDVGFFSRLFGSNPSERIALKLPREISLITKGVNGSLVVGDLDGSVEVHSINGRVQIAGTSGSVDFKGVNGNIVVGLKQLNGGGVSIGSVNGSIELRLNEGLNADLDTHGMNGRVMSELSEVQIVRNRRGNYSARIGNGGSMITANGINGNIRLTRGTSTPSASTEAGKR